MDKIIITGAVFLCNLGVSEKERAKKQKVIVDLELFINKKIIKAAAKTDDIMETVNYSHVHHSIKNIFNHNHKIVETISEEIAANILDNFSVGKVIVRVKKPEGLSKKNVRYVAVEITRKKEFQ